MTNNKWIRIKNLPFKIFKVISYRGVSENMDIRKRDYLVLLNQYLLMVSLIFLLHSTSNFVFLGYTIDALGLLLISLFFSVACLFFNFLKTNKYFITLVFFVLAIVITYYSSFCGIESGIYLFFIPLLSALPIFFSFKGDKYFVIPITIFILICLYASALVDFTLF